MASHRHQVILDRRSAESVTDQPDFSISTSTVNRFYDCISEMLNYYEIYLWMVAQRVGYDARGGETYRRKV